jgi:broad specificity polyphosphatase/5'/3'-nucleotidase SurE
MSLTNSCSAYKLRQWIPVSHQQYPVFEMVQIFISYCSVDAVRYGIQTLAPKYFGTKPDLVVSGSNIGSEFWSLSGLHNKY